jgi:hypothetical protein
MPSVGILCGQILSAKSTIIICTQEWHGD